MGKKIDLELIDYFLLKRIETRSEKWNRRSKL